MNKHEKITIIVAMHKKYRTPHDSIYLPLHVGAENNINITHNISVYKDNTGDNISSLNFCFCELTGLYWAWKNLLSDYIGLVHYRRYFTAKYRLFAKNPFENVLTFDEIQPFLGAKNVFVPNPRRYFIESLSSHYRHTMDETHLDKTRIIVAEKYPVYLDSFDKVMRRTWGYMFNMMILERNLLDSYCTWLFDILFALYEQVDTSVLSPFQARFCGRIGELLFNVWLDYQIENGYIRPDEIQELPWLSMEKVNWWKKGTSFLSAKFLGQRYERSF